MVMCVEMPRKEQLKHDLLRKENVFVGKRVRFKAINDPHSKLSFNDLGTIAGITYSSNWNGSQTKLCIRWDKDDNYTSIDNFDSIDVFKEAGI